jgi:hypothetical protein
LTEKDKAMTDRGEINRSGLSIMSYQIEGLCTAFRLAVQSRAPIGPGSIAMLSRIFNEFKAAVQGTFLDGFPAIEENMQPVDALAVAETLRTTIIAFLSKDDLADHAKSFGFARGAQQ